MKSPDASTPILFFSFSNLFLFFLLLFIGLYSLITFLFGSKKRGIIYSLGISLFFLLRVYKLTNPLYLILLLLLILGLEFLFTPPKKEKTHTR